MFSIYCGLPMDLPASTTHSLLYDLTSTVKISPGLRVRPGDL